MVRERSNEKDQREGETELNSLRLFKSDLGTYIRTYTATAWAQRLLARESGATVVILGGTTNSSSESLYGVGNDAGDLNGYSPTYLANKCYDASW